MEQTSAPGSRTFLVKLTLLAWFSMVGFDLFLHAGILAPLYTQPGPFLLSPERSFALIPVGYVSFLLLAVLLVWLMHKLELKGWRPGAIFGAQLGGLAWGALVLGLYSISTAPPTLLFGWFVGQTVELSLAGAVTGIGLERASLKRLFFQVLGLVVLLFALSVVLQNIGVAANV